MNNLLASNLGLLLLACPAEPAPAPETELEAAWFVDESEVEAAPSTLAAAAAGKRDAAAPREAVTTHGQPDTEDEPEPPAPQAEPAEQAEQAEQAEPALGRSDAAPPSSAGGPRRASERADAPAAPETPPPATLIADAPSPAAAEAEPEPEVTPFERLRGTYRYAGGATQRSKIADAVEEVVAQMSIVGRGIARRRLLESAEPPNSLRIGIDGDQITVAFPHRTYTATLGAAPVGVEGKAGERLQLTARSRGAQLMLEFRGDKGGKRYVMRRGTGDHLRVRVTIFSSSLPASVVYQLTYKAT